MDKGLQLLSLCRRAGKLRIGYDAVEQAARRREAAAVLLSRELAERTRRHAEQFCRQTRTPVYFLSYSFDDLAPFLGRRAGILCITDTPFAKAIVAAAHAETATGTS